MEKLTIHKRIVDAYNAIKADKLSGIGRIAMDCVRLNCNRIYSTNGHFLVSLPKPEGLPSNVSIKVNRARLGKADGADLSLVSDSDGIKEYASADCAVSLLPDSLEFPPVEKVVPSDDDKSRTVRIGLNADYLLRIAEAINSSDKRPEVVLEIDPTDSSKAIKVTTQRNSDGGFGILMPVRL